VRDDAPVEADPHREPLTASTIAAFALDSLVLGSAFALVLWRQGAPFLGASAAVVFGFGLGLNAVVGAVVRGPLRAFAAGGLLSALAYLQGCYVDRGFELLSHVGLSWATRHPFDAFSFLAAVPTAAASHAWAWRRAASPLGALKGAVALAWMAGLVLLLVVDALGAEPFRTRTPGARPFEALLPLFLSASFGLPASWWLSRAAVGALLRKA